ncbi:hypothetical protein G3I15_20065, partial [Streptomyces sp. SID10244]|nr:hypothetical protein [Streptomyces sp. SID10244]
MIVLCAWCVGQGTSLLDRDVYLASNGNDFFLRATMPGGVLVAIGTVATAFLTNDRRARIALIILTALWFIGLLSIGTRGALAILVVVGLMLLQLGRARPEQRRRRFTQGGLALLSAVLAFSVVIEARYGPHG